MAEVDIPAQEPSFKDAVPISVQAPGRSSLIERLHAELRGTVGDTALKRLRYIIPIYEKMREAEGIPNISVELDSTVPTDEIRVRSQGKEVARIVNIGPTPQPTYEDQLATVESMMTCYDTPLTQSAGYVRDLLRTIIALRGREISILKDGMI